MKKLFLSAAVLVVGVLLPFSTQAATLQQRFDQILAKQNKGAQAVTLQMTVDLDERFTDRKKLGDKLSLDLMLEARTQTDAATGILNSEGRLTVSRARGVLEGNSFDVTRPFVAEWTQVGSDVYLRATEISPEVKMMAQESMGVEIDSILGTWVRIPFGEYASMLGAEFSTQTSQDPWKNFASSLMGVSVMRVTGIEKRWKSPSGDQMIRVRGMINPVMITRLRAEALKQLDRKAPDYQSELTTLNKYMQELRTTVAKMQFAFVVNETQGRIERSEMGMRVTQPIKKTEWVGRRSVVRTIGQQSMRLMLGGQMKAGSIEAIVAPAEFSSFEQYADKLMPPLEATSDSETLTAI